MSDAQHKNDVHRAATQQAVDMAAAADQHRETEIKSYLDSMSTLLENPNLRDLKKGGDLRSLARVQTLTILRELGQDGARKAVVVGFLHDAGLFNRDPSPIVNLAGADLTWAMLNGINLGGADLAGADLTRANLTGTYLSGADLDQATLKGADLTGANLDFAQLTNTDLTCADPKTCTKLAKADLSGANFASPNLARAIFNHTEVTGTNFPNGFAQGLTGGKAFTRKWRVFQQDNILKIDHNDGSLLPTYGQLDLNTGKLQLVYGPSGNFGTSVVLFPAVWSRTSCPGDYCQTASVTGGTYSSLLHIDLLQTRKELSQNTLTFTVSGTIAGLSVEDTLTFSQPMDNSISVTVDATSSGTITLDSSAFGVPLHREAFKPVILAAMYDSASTWSAQGAAFGNQPSFSLTANYPRTTMNTISTFELVGGTSSAVTVRNAPTISVTLNSLSETGTDLKFCLFIIYSRICTLNSLSETGTDLTANTSETLQVQPGSNQSDNVNMWLGLDSPNQPDSWNYTVVASIPPKP